MKRGRRSQLSKARRGSNSVRLRRQGHVGFRMPANVNEGGGGGGRERERQRERDRERERGVVVGSKGARLRAQFWYKRPNRHEMEE